MMIEIESFSSSQKLLQSVLEDSHMRAGVLTRRRCRRSHTETFSLSLNVAHSTVVSPATTTTTPRPPHVAI